jgi:hypothetical protein
MKQKILKILLGLSIVTSIVTGLMVSAHADRDPQDSIQPSDSVALPGFPVIGKWMIDQDGQIAHWLTYIYHGNKLAEPINVIIRVNRQTDAEAKEALMQATEAAGFKVRPGHSSGYQAILGEERVPQFPDTAGHAFSDRTYLLPNDHGRIFGPVAYQGNFYFIAALSREGENWVGKMLDHNVSLHPYHSFQEARTKFVSDMCRDGRADISGVVNMQNALPLDDERSTGDHDGTATILDLK